MKSFVIAIAVVLILAQGCSPAGGNRTGHEFMPDMVHSTAYEANLYNYYYYHTWGTEEEYKEFVMHREPVAGTVPRGYSSVYYEDGPAEVGQARDNRDDPHSPNGIVVPANGHVPYYYGDTEEERVRASREIVRNPFPITEEGLAVGEELYNIYCGICHGDNADGLGYLVREADPAQGIPAGVYPAAPANMQQDTFHNSTNGRYYHSIMYGKNLMGSYADKLSFEERWQVIHYIRSLQARELGLEYSEQANTFTNDIPGALIAARDEEHAESAPEDEEMPGEGGHGSDGEEGDNH